MRHIIIDASGQILGRLATFAAKKALLGYKVDIVNCDEAVISGTKEIVQSKFLRKIKLGVPLKGPYYPRQSDRIVRRTVRGMLPYKKAKGIDAYKRVMCYRATPDGLKGKTIKVADADSQKLVKKVRLADICKLIGGK
ncbi:MAG: 50S ribosomal protein L13 [Candidatus Woesearchaeota archaeon]